MKRGVLLGVLCMFALSMSFAFALDSQYHSSESVIGEAASYRLSLEQAIDRNFVNSNMINLAENLIESGDGEWHLMEEVYVSVDGADMSLQNAIETEKGLCGLTESYYNSSVALGHLADEIEIRDGVSLQDAINDGEFCVCGSNSEYNFSSESCVCSPKWQDVNGDGTGSDWDGCETSAYRSCKEIMEDGYSTGDGLYTIDADGDGSLAPFQVYCDMTHESGGWTLYAYHEGYTLPARASLVSPDTGYGVMQDARWVAVRDNMETGMMFLDEDGILSMISAQKLWDGKCIPITDTDTLILSTYSGAHSRKIWWDEPDCSGTNEDYSMIHLYQKPVNLAWAGGATLYQASPTGKFDIWPYGTGFRQYASPNDELFYFIK